RDHVRTWTTTEAAQAVEAAAAGDRARGQALFTAVSCASCHRIAGQGGALGPDLSGAARRFSRHDLLQAIIEPDRDRSDQYGLVRMPTGLLDTLDADELADLMAFLENPE
ncbi:MAG: cytochrome c, partial [Planctomycetota bacterium]|nr:cytochrome c [Planctomycetota bacterium]